MIIYTTLDYLDFVSNCFCYLGFKNRTIGITFAPEVYESIIEDVKDYGISPATEEYFEILKMGQKFKLYKGRTKRLKPLISLMRENETPIFIS